MMPLVENGTPSNMDLFKLVHSPSSDLDPGTLIRPQNGYSMDRGSESRF